MSKVYFKAVESYTDTDGVNNASVELLERLIDDHKLQLEPFIPMKVHFGEAGNKTYIEAKNYQRIIGYLEEKNVKSAFIETNVLYRGQRTTATDHKKLAAEHGFTMLPVIIADGEHGEDYQEVAIHQKHFDNCKIGTQIAEQQMMLVMSHFKGHALAGFGGAIKQLAMGCASRGGKLAQHANSIPKISSRKCKACGACVKQCPENAIVLHKKAKILKDDCVGCASCMTACPFGAVTNSWLASLSKSFHERLAEYAYAAHHGKSNIYVTYAFNITKNCDCDGHAMKPIVKDLGVLVSLDPVAIDQASLDLLERENHKPIFKRGRHTLEYAEKIGLGSRNYELLEV